MSMTAEEFVKVYKNYDIYNYHNYLNKLCFKMVGLDIYYLNVKDPWDKFNNPALLFERAVKDGRFTYYSDEVYDAVMVYVEFLAMQFSMQEEVSLKTFLINLEMTYQDIKNNIDVSDCEDCVDYLKKMSDNIKDILIEDEIRQSITDVPSNDSLEDYGLEDGDNDLILDEVSIDA